MTYTEKTFAFRDQILKTRRTQLQLLTVLVLGLGIWAGIWIMVIVVLT
jgi:hypothetical protein